MPLASPLEDEKGADRPRKGSKGERIGGEGEGGGAEALERELEVEDEEGEEADDDDGDDEGIAAAVVVVDAPPRRLLRERAVWCLAPATTATQAAGRCAAANRRIDATGGMV